MSLAAVPPFAKPEELKPVCHDAIRAIISMIGATSKDSVRYQLGHVRIEPTPTGAKLVACDGHILAERIVECEGLSSLCTVHYLHRDEISILKLILKSLSPTIPVLLDRKEGKVVLGMLGLSPQLILKTEKDVPDYPDYAAVKPTFPEDSFSIGINAALLTRLAEALRDHNKKDHLGVKLTFNGKMTPMRVQFGDNGTGLVMPMKL